jgi:NAD(P)-dependent dehydrogenase (short-subunit alcohol dehydrogenase family)
MIKNEVVAITGCCGRIGSALSSDLIKKGYKVLLGDINKKKLLLLKKKLNSKRAVTYSGDLTKTKYIDKFISTGMKHFKKIDSVVCCSYPISKKWGTSFEKLEEKYIREDLYNQLGATMIFCQRIIKNFLKLKSGNIILLSSIQGVQAPKFDHYKKTQMTSPIEYSAIKSGIISMTKYLAKYYKNKNLRINSISPGGIESNQPKNFIKKYRSACNSKGLLNGQDISDLIIFLLSKKSQYITGQNIIIDDGWSL